MALEIPDDLKQMAVDALVKNVKKDLEEAVEPFLAALRDLSNRMAAAINATKLPGE